LRRALRILPAYYAVLSLLAITRQASWPFLSLSFCYLSNVTTIFGIPREYGVLWSLAVEEHFYLLWPTVVRRLQQGSLAICALAIVLALPVLRGLSFFYGYREGLNHYTWFVVDGMASGALLAMFVRRPSVSRATVARSVAWALAASAGILAFGAPFGMWTQRRLLGAALQVVPWNIGFTAFVALMLLLGTSRWKFLVRRPVLTFFGDISYGLYLIHILVFNAYDKIVQHFWPALTNVQAPFAHMVLRFVCVAGAAVALAFLSRRYFEEPFLRLKKRFPLTEDVEARAVEMKDFAVSVNPTN
jgi:peptidoglycan/LPS O-acetylase OafA/YrhL